MTGFDPSRIEVVSRGCDAILHRLNAVPPHYAETVEELERRHDNLEEEVRNLIGMLRTLANAIAMEAREGPDRETGLDGEAATARPEGIAQ